jgi:hypothetical protein
MTYIKKKPDSQGKPFSDLDLKKLKALFGKYGIESFDAACREVKSKPLRGAGREKRYIGNLISVLIAVDELAKAVGDVERALDVLDNKVPTLAGKKYKRSGLRSIYYKAVELLEIDPIFANHVEQARDARKHPERAIVIGDPIPKGLTMGPAIPLMMKITSK